MRLILEIFTMANKYFFFPIFNYRLKDLHVPSYGLTCTVLRKLYTNNCEIYKLINSDQSSKTIFAHILSSKAIYLLRIMFLVWIK